MEEKSVKSQIQAALRSSASSGDFVTVARLVDSISLADVNSMDNHGWTALMLAARNGHNRVVRLLLDKGCDPSLMNKAGQTASNISEFWNHSAVTHCIRQHLQGAGCGKHKMSSTSYHTVTNFFGLSLLDRYSHKRIDKKWLERQLKAQTTHIILFNQTSPYVSQSDSKQYQVCRFQFDQIPLLQKELDYEQPSIIFLGVGHIPDSNDKYSSSGSLPRNDESGLDCPAWFAVSAANIPLEMIQDVHPNAELLSSRDLVALMSVADTDACIIGQARALLSWHDRYKFCPTCGSLTCSAEAGYKRTCENKECRSHKGVHNTSYPRVDPVAIMAVIHPDGNKLLLGRKKTFPSNMYSCLAGFMEPGETIEDACRREVLEESGIKVGNVTYHSSQPWPMPSQLMIGCFGYAVSTEITEDTEELESVVWFEKQDIVAALQMNLSTSDHDTGSHHSEIPKLFLPPKQAIAHQLIKAWVGITSSL